ncbi:MAG: acetyl-CoA carboxylase carboxyltransferase subunit beta [Vallitaleaceae bacterium]|nr:acetyl-CoA carboxylase carboxyltransferase subunit beta [Vallitaleaceae bacterium]
MRNIFKKTQYVQINNVVKSPVVQKEPNVPSGSWIKCSECGGVIYKDDLCQNAFVCPECNQHFRISSTDRIKLLVDEGSYVNRFSELITKNVLEFKGYDEKIQQLKDKTGIDEAILTGSATIEGHKVAIGVMDSRFLMGSMGHVVGEKITLLAEFACKEKLPLILYTASGGARMQEGIISLMQMAKTSAAIKKFHEAGGLYITVLTDPTSGGVTASFAMLGDIILSEPGAFIGFAGPRVIRDTIKQELPEGFQKAEFLLEHGFLDGIFHRKEQKEKLAKILEIHGY